MSIELANWNAYFEERFQHIPLGERKKPGVMLRVIPPKEEWEEFLSIVRRDWRFGRLGEFHYCLTSLFAGIAFFEYESGNFWEPFAEALGLASTSELKTGELNESFSIALEKIDLELLRTEARTDYVGTAVFQIGIPLSLWDEFLRICEYLWWKDDWRNYNSREWADFVSRRVGGLKRLERFLVKNPRTARKFIEEVHDARRLIASGEIGVAELSNISFLRAEYLEEVPETAQFLSPNKPDLLFANRFRLIWKELESKISVYLPPVHSTRLPATWKLNELEQPADVYPQEFEINSLAFAGNIELLLQSELKDEKKTLAGIGKWSLFDDETRSLVNITREVLPLKSYSLISSERLDDFMLSGFDADLPVCQAFFLNDGSSCFLTHLVPLDQKAKISFTCHGVVNEIKFRTKGKVDIFLLAGLNESAAKFRLFENTIKVEVLPVPCLTLPTGWFDENEVDLAEIFKVSLNGQQVSGQWKKGREDNHNEIFYWQWNPETNARKKVDLTIECERLGLKRDYKIEVQRPRENLTMSWSNLPGKFLPFIILAQPSFKSNNGLSYDEMREIKELIAKGDRFVGESFFYYCAKFGVLKGLGKKWQFAYSKLYLGESDYGPFLRFCGSPSVFWRLMRFVADKCPNTIFEPIEVVAKRDSLPHLFLNLTPESRGYFEKYVRDYGEDLKLTLVNSEWES